MNKKEHYSEIKVVSLPKMRLAKHIVISLSPEDDALNYMKSWAKKNLLTENGSFKPKIIGWDFPFISKEQKEKYKLHGYVAGCTIPEDFVPEDSSGVDIGDVKENTYATITITNPQIDPWGLIPNAYQILFDYVKPSSWENIFAFEEEYDIDGVHYMDVFFPMN